MSSIYWLARGGSAMAGWVPRPLRHALGSTVSSASYLGWRSKRLVTQQNMAKVLGLPVNDARVRRAAFDSWSKYGRYASDFMYFPHMDMERMEAHSRDLTQGATWQEYVRQALEPAKGVILATAHFGSWDMAGALVARYFSLSAVAETFSDPRLNELLQNQRREKKIGIIPLEGSARRILRALQENTMVAIVADRPMTKETGVEITFFGYKTYVPGGPAALALKSGAAILPGFVWYGHHQQFYVRAFPPLFPQVCQGTEERNREIARLTQYIYSSLEEVAREWPTQWFMFRPFWPAEAVQA
ncbi:MAG TPA: lysophospholipid acyltransferase family protein [Ktedonobacteraceae bacterium]|nr:lysophospholipid acyltransferase family protein [Ktedonobacteraceae bacterium]